MKQPKLSVNRQQAAGLILPELEPPTAREEVNEAVAKRKEPP